MTEYLSPPGLSSSPFFSHVAIIKRGKVVYISGQAPIDEKGELVGRGDFRMQAEKVFSNLQVALAAAGISPSDVVLIETFYLAGWDRPAYRELRQKFFAGRASPPASTTVQVAGLITDGAMLEISLVAVAQGRRPKKSH